MRLEKRVEEHRKDLHGLGQDELPGRGRVRAVLAVRREALRARTDVLVGHLTRRLVRQLLRRYNAHRYRVLYIDYQCTP